METEGGEIDLVAFLPDVFEFPTQILIELKEQPHINRKGHEAEDPVIVRTNAAKNMILIL